MSCQKESNKSLQFDVLIEEVFNRLRFCRCFLLIRHHQTAAPSIILHLPWLHPSELLRYSPSALSLLTSPSSFDPSTLSTFYCFSCFFFYLLSPAAFSTFSLFFDIHTLCISVHSSHCLSLSLHLSPSLSHLGSSPSDQHGSSKPPLSSSAMTSRILLRQQLMREQLQEQERREQQRQQATQYPQTPVTQTPAINVSVPVSLPPAAQVPMEVLKVRKSHRGL